MTEPQVVYTVRELFDEHRKILERIERKVDSKAAIADVTKLRKDVDELLGERRFRRSTRRTVGRALGFLVAAAGGLAGWATLLVQYLNPHHP